MGKIKDLIEVPKQASTIAIAAVFIAVVAMVISMSALASTHRAIWSEATK